jgi:radical SAM protein with 4Fe4S-binding SPASM domain
LVSFPHYEEEEYNRITQSNDYKKVLANFELALQFELPVEANMVVLPDTVDDVLKTGIFLKEKLGIDHFGVSPVQITDSYLNRYLLTKEQLNHILDQLIELNRAENIETAVVRPIEPCAIENKDILDKYPEFVKSCPAGIQELTITSWGEIKACKSYSRSYGTVFSTNVNNAMVKMNEWRSFSSGKSIIPEECFNCTLFTFCRGGCRAEALNLKNHLKATSINYTGPITGRVPTWFTDPFYQIENININPDIKVLNREDGGLDIISKHGLINLNSQEKHLFKCLTKYILENEFNLDKFISEYELRYDFVFYFIDYLLSREVFLPD